MALSILDQNRAHAGDIETMMYALEDAFGVLEPTFVASDESLRCITDSWKSKTGHTACKNLVHIEQTQRTPYNKSNEYTVPM